MQRFLIDFRSQESIKKIRSMFSFYYVITERIKLNWSGSTEAATIGVLKKKDVLKNVALFTREQLR